MKHLKTFLLNSIILCVSSLFLQIIRLIFNIYVSNKITTEALGVFQLIMTTYMFGITIASSGINISCMKTISEELAIGNTTGVKQIIKKCIKISLILSILACFIFFVCDDLIVKYCFHNKVSPNVIYLICIALPIISVSSAINGYFIAVERIYKTVIGQFLEQISKFIAIALLLKIFLPTENLEYICYALILGDVISEAIFFIYISICFVFDIKKHFYTLKLHTKINYTPKILKILVPISITSYIRSGLSTIKQLIIPTSLEKSGASCKLALEAYGTISGMAMPIVLFPTLFLSAISSLLIPEFTRFFARKDYTRIKKNTKRLIILSIVFSSIITIFFLIFGDQLGKLIYNNEHVGLYITTLSVLIPLMYIDIIIDSILKGLNAQVSVMIINVIDLIVTVFIIYFIVPKIGIKGYILSIYVSELLNFVCSYRCLMSKI